MGETELGYSFKREYWGKGYATEVSQTLVKWIFEESRHRVCCGRQCGLEKRFRKNWDELY
jgi:Acetyltransferase (GNAT) domain